MSASTDPATIPRIVIDPPPQAGRHVSSGDDDPVLALLDELRSPSANLRALDLARALIAEGRSFAETPSGRRWTALLSRSSLVENGWLLWNYANLDLSLGEGEQSDDSPADMLEEVLRRLLSGDLERYVSVLGNLLAEEAIEKARQDPR
jgi:hypothetical protein